MNRRLLVAAFGVIACAMNHDLNKAADVAKKAYGRFADQMRREGHTKREELSADNIDPKKLSRVALALWYEYKAREADLFAQAEETLAYDGHVKVTQPALGEDPPKKPATSGRGKKTEGARKDNTIDLRERFLKVLDGIPRHNIGAQRFSEMKRANAYDTLATDKPKAETCFEFDGRLVVVTAVIDAPGVDPSIILTPVHDPAAWGDKPTHKQASQISDGTGLEGLIFSHKRKKYIVGAQSERMVVQVGDILADYVEATAPKDGEPLVSYDSAETETVDEPAIEGNPQAVANIEPDPDAGTDVDEPERPMQQDGESEKDNREEQEQGDQHDAAS